MPKTETTPAVQRPWLPAKGQWFNVRLKGAAHLHPAGPFKCGEVVFARRYVHQIAAVDADGDAWQFLLRDFRFEPAEVVKTAAKGR